MLCFQPHFGKFFDERNYSLIYNLSCNNDEATHRNPRQREPASFKAKKEEADLEDSCNCRPLWYNKHSRWLQQRCRIVYLHSSFWYFFRFSIALLHKQDSLRLVAVRLEIELELACRPPWPATLACCKLYQKCESLCVPNDAIPSALWSGCYGIVTMSVLHREIYHTVIILTRFGYSRLFRERDFRIDGKGWGGRGADCQTNGGYRIIIDNR